MHTQSIRVPHLSLFGRNEDDGENVELATATIADRGGDIFCVVRGTGIAVTTKGRLSSSFVADVPGLGPVIWKGDRQALNAIVGGKEVARLVMGKPRKEDDWVVTATWELLGTEVRGLEEREVLLVTGLAVQEAKKRRGQGVWGNIGVGGVSSAVM